MDSNGQDDDTFTSMMLLNIDQLQKQLEKDESQEDGSMATFWVINKQFQKFINSQFTLDYDSQMADNGIESEMQDESTRSGNDTDTNDANIKPIYDEEPMVEITSLLANNADLKTQIQEKVFAIAALKNELRKLKGNSVDTKFAKTSVLGKPVLQPLRNQSVVRQPNAFKSERPKIPKLRFASQVDVKKICQNQSLNIICLREKNMLF
nr:hypothetical protein [Tanacetum cinerariifolium]